jgi:hypothetical protein
LILLAACGKPPTSDDFASDGKSDSFRAHVTILGTLAPGDSQTVHYTSPPKYRGFTIHATAGQLVDVWVRSSNGDAMVWLLSGGQIVAQNDDADGTDAHIAVAVAAGSYTVAFRDYYQHAADFTVSLAGSSSGSSGSSSSSGSTTSSSGSTTGACSECPPPACGAQGSICTRNSDCCGTLACYEGLCERPRPNNTVCESDRDCASGICCRGNCGPCPSEPPSICSGIDGDCWSQNDCCAGFVCINVQRNTPGSCVR